MNVHPLRYPQEQGRMPTTEVLERDLFLPSFAQERLWFLHQLEPESSAYSLFASFDLQGDLHIDLFAASLQAIIARHEALRTTFVNVDGALMQAIAPHGESTLPIIDLSGLPEAERLSLRDTLIRQATQQPFDLSRGPLLRVQLVRMAARQHVFILSLHHIITDNWSIQLFIREFAAHYNAALVGERVELPELPIQYADYAEWQREWLNGAMLPDQLAYWQRQLAGVPAVLNLPTDRPRPTLTMKSGGQHFLKLPAELNQRLRALAQREGVTYFMLLLATFQLLLMRLGGEEDIVVGTPVAGRTRAELESLMGLFVNTLALRGDVKATKTFRHFLAEVRETCLQAYEHQDVPFEKLVEAINPDRVPGYSPLFQTFFVLQNAKAIGNWLTGITLTLLESSMEGNKFDLGLGLWDLPGVLQGDIEYNADIFTADTIARIAAMYETLLWGIVANPDEQLARLPLLTPAEREHLFDLWAPPRDIYPATSIPALFAEQVGATPDAIAVCWREEQMTFARLQWHANQLARYLHDHGVGPETPVAVCCHRSIDMLVALLGVLAAGAAYVPLDLAAPPDRHAYLLRDAGVEILITQASHRERFAGLVSEVISIDDDWPTIAAYPDEPPDMIIASEQTAYIIYTSGSTGQPKGVVVPHRALIDRIFSIKARYELTATDRLLQFVSMSFDVSLEEIFPTWMSGAALVILPEDGVPPLAQVTRLAHEQCISVLDLPPSYWHEWVSELTQARSQLPASLRLLILGSEASSPSTLAVWEELTGGRVAWCNVYGLTETTLIVMTYGPHNNQGWQDYASLPIGRALENTRLYVLDDNLQPVPIGLAGELYIGGPGLARGYHGRPEQTAERFIPDPFAHDEPGARMYRTGDLARTLANGLFQFLGRTDTQVKIRGFRVEPEEIEALLRRYPGVREAIVLSLNEAGQYDGAASAERLVGFVITGRQNDALKARLLLYLEKHLPAYMVPSDLILLDALPRTPGGKADRRALARLARPDRAAVTKDIAYRTGEETRLAQIWSGVLRLAEIGRDDDFFKLGGHSLQATQIIARIQNDFGVALPVRAIYDAPLLCDLAARVAELARTTAPVALSIPVASRAEPLPLSFAQLRLWFLEQLEPGSPQYTIPTALVLRGALDCAALWRSLDTIIQRHEALRTAFDLVNGEPTQSIAPTLHLALPIIDLSHIADRTAQEAALHQVLADEGSQTFDISRGPLVRMWLVRRAEQDHVLLIAQHHMVADGWSSDIFLRELRAGYAAYAVGATPDLPALPIQYADYAVWQRERLRGATLDTLIAFWQRHLAGAPPLLELPTDFPRPAQMRYRGTHVTFQLPGALAASLRSLSQREGVTQYILLLAAFQTLLARYAGQDDFVVGTPVGGRQQRETEDVIGLFVNTLALRADLTGDPAFVDLVHRVYQMSLEAFDHQELPFEKLVEAVQPERSLSYTPIFQVVFAMQHATGAGPLPDLTMQSLDWGGMTAKFDLTLTMTEANNDLYGWLEYNTDLFAPATVARLIAHWETLLTGITAAPETPISRLPLLTADERHQICNEWTATERPYPRDATIHDVFARQVVATPDAIALSDSEEHLSYEEIDRRANQLAHLLRGYAVGPNVPIGLCLERSNLLVIALLAILKAGGYYVPFDPDYPTERLTFMLQDAAIDVLLTESTLRARLPATTPCLCLDLESERIAAQPSHAPDVATIATDLAYVNYTSGSTGVPKGVCIPHRAVLRLVRGNTFADLSAAHVFLQLAPIAFDAATLEIWGPLLNGGRLVMAPPGTPTLDALGALILSQGITTLWLTAGLLHLMVEEQLPSLLTLRQLLAGGDVLSVPHVRTILGQHSGTVLINGYGPTENTTFTCCYPMTDPDAVATTVPIGKPIANTQVYILDAQMQPMPIGIPGELYIGGDGLARGYLNRPELTAERFVGHPFAADATARLYRTGDRVRYLSDGTIEFLGRLDDQVKIHGYRIEPGEVEHVLSQYPAIAACTVVARRDDASTRLVAYLVPREPDDTIVATARAFLKGHLPDYMLPAAFVVLEALPLNANGKVDRRQLPMPEARRATSLPTAETAPQTDAERALSRIWSQVLRQDAITRYDNFFEVGGDSILSMQIIARARQAGWHITAKQIFQYQTIMELAAVATPVAHQHEAQGVIAGDVPLTPIQRWFFEQDLAEPHHFNQSVLLAATDLDGDALRTAFNAILVHHDALRLRFEHDGAAWRQSTAGADDLPGDVFTEVDLTRQMPEQQRQSLTRLTAAFQASLDLARGALVRAVLFRLGGDLGDRLLIIIHHLAVDGVSWRIVLDDLATAYAQARAGATIALPPKTMAFQHWAQRLHAAAQSPAMRQQALFWREMGRDFPSRIPTELPGSAAENTEGAAQAVEMVLTPAETAALLHVVPKAYHTQINDALLTALAAAVREWTGGEAVGIELEGHGRAGIFDDGDLSRTVGWFTAIYPVRLDLAGATEIGTMLTTVKEQLRQIPANGIGYGILRYLHDDPAISDELRAQPPAAITFNYLGQFGGGEAPESALFRAAPEATGPEISPRARRRSLIEVLGSVAADQLRFTWVYCPHIHHRATIEHITTRFTDYLRAIIAHCQSPEVGGFTPSDFPLARLNTARLQKIAQLIDDEEE